MTTSVSRRLNKQSADINVAPTRTHYLDSEPTSNCTFSLLPRP